MKLKSWSPGRTSSSSSREVWQSQPSSEVVREYQAFGCPRRAPAGNGDGTAGQVYAAEPDRESKTGPDRGPGKANANHGEKVPWPSLATAGPVGSSQSSRPDLVSERARLTELETRDGNAQIKVQQSPGRATLAFGSGSENCRASSGPKRWKKRTISTMERASRKRASMKRSIPPGCLILVSSRRLHRPTRAKRDVEESRPRAWPAGGGDWTGACFANRIGSGPDHQAALGA